MSDVPDWLVTFFNAGNKIKLDKVLNKSYPPEFNNLLETLLIPALEGDFPLFLPMNSDRLWFYALAEDIRELTELKRVIKSHLGSVNIYPDLPINNIAENDAESALISKFPFGFIKFTLLDSVKDDPKAKANVFSNLAKILAIYKLKPILTTEAQRPVGRVLRDFFTSCQVGDGKNSLKFFYELKASGSFSQRNILFLELQALYASGMFSEIIEHKNLIDLLSGRVPQRITQILLRSVGCTGLGKILQDDIFPAEDLKSIRLNCEKLSPLFERQPNFESHPALIDDWKLWAIGSAALGLTIYRTYLPNFIDSDWVRKLSKWAGFETDKQLIESHAEVFEQPLELNGLTSLLRRSLMAGPDELAQIVSLLKSIPLELRNQLEKFQVLKSLMDSLLAEQFIHQSGGWVEWFGEMSKPNAVFSSLGQEFHTSYLHWKTETFDEEKILRFLQECSSDGVGGVFRNILPLLVSWLDQRQIKCSANFWITWLELLALDDIVSTQDLRLADLIATNILKQPYTKDDYLRVIEPLEVLWGKISSPAGFSAVLEIMETLLESSCPDQNARMKFWQTIQSYSLQRWSRLEVAEHFLTKCIANEILGEEALAAFPLNSFPNESTELSGDIPNLTGKLLGIYTLTEGAARRAKGVLESMFNGLEVEMNHDHTATAGLTNLAKKADYFVFAANSAKHQAFNPVSKIRGDLIYPQGKGASSIIKSFLEAAT